MADHILVGTRKGTFLVEKSGGSWKPRLSGHAGVSVNFVMRDPHSGDYWAALGFGHWGAKVSRSSDNGRSWSDASQVKYPAGARYLAPPMPEEGSTEITGPAVIKDATLLKLWTIAFGPPGSIYVGTIPGGLFVSKDGGEHFELNLPLWNHESRGGDLFNGAGSGETHWWGTPASEGGEFAPGIHSILVDPRDPDRVLVAISSAGVLETADGGLFVGRTHDGGESWEVLREGLPQENAYDVVLRHALGNSGDQLAFGSTTGNLYLSEDRGESWRTVANNLPPIYSVRFG